MDGVEEGGPFAAGETEWFAVWVRRALRKLISL
jgi:hypothetical protein